MNPSVSLRFRQVHLDFHTSEHIPNIGAEFDEGQFIDCLKKGHVNSINVFAQCHHGWCYYPTATDMRHPHLQTDLLGRMLAAGRDADILMPVYITVGWNDKAAREHPEWLVRRPDGGVDGPPRLHPHSPRPGGWYRLCYNSPYLDKVTLVVTREVLERYNPVGFWFDITGEHECVCDYCVAGMKRRGLSPANPADRKTWAVESYRDYLKKTTDLVWGYNPAAWIYHNGFGLKGRRDAYPYWSHYEIESLPTGGWGYNHFPSYARYFTMLPDCDVVSMSGKFHRSWGEFGGFKNPVALRYEVAQMLALGCKCCVGDQLHPGGRMDEETYRIIGEAFADVEAREEWLADTRPVADVAILSPSAVLKDKKHDRSETGASQMLLELQVPFVVLDAGMDFTPYKVLVLPDSVLVDSALRAKLNSYLAAGGALILSAESGLDTERRDFAVDIGAQYAGPSPWDVEYIAVREPIARDLVRSPFLIYQSGVTTRVTDAETLADVWQPYFSRTYEHFCSHRNTPPEKLASWPGVIRKGRVIHIAQPVFRVYEEQGMQLHRDLVRNCLAMLYTDPLVKTNLPSCGRISTMSQSGHPPAVDRWIAHLLYANPIRRGATEVIEDIVPLSNVTLDLRTGRRPTSAYLAPQRSALEFSYHGGRVSVTVPKLEMSQMVVFEFPRS